MDRGLVDNHQPALGSTFEISGSSHETCNLCTPLDSMFRVSDSAHSIRTHGSYITCISPNRRCHNVLPANPVNSQTSGARDAIQPSTPERSKQIQQPVVPRQTSVL